MTDPRAAIPDHDFIRLFETIGPEKLARQLGHHVRSVYKRRDTLERDFRRQITPPRANNVTRHNIEHAARLHFDVENGVVLVGSDAHIWPGPMTTAMRAFIKFAKEMKPKAVVLNGDVMDHPQISRHPPIGWEDHPTVEQEIKAAQEILAKIEDAAPDKSKLYWTLGNHDSRFETRLATVAPEYARLNGFHLKDHFPGWAPCWSVWLNNDVVIKHRYKGGIGATRANVLNAGKHIVTGHLHSANVRGLTDYNGTRWAMDTGCLADPAAEAFVHYTEDGPLDWRSAFGVLTFWKGQLLQPELVLALDKNHVQFRGEVIKV
jgi:Calcineurin-like phosphoesterase.